MSRHKHIVFSCVIALLTAQSVFAQVGFDLAIKKPEPYDNRELKAEKPQDKKLKANRRFFQNMYTHYNYFFNANTKLNEIIDRAKVSHKDDYSELLPFYNYSLETTTQDSLELDSVIYKTRTGIVLHDLRNDWVDNLYLLWGAAYYFQQQFDSAYQMFQFINYAFAEKEKDGYYKYIGSRMDGNNALSISTKEKSSLPKRALSEPPSRNDALLWQIRTMIQQGALPESGSLIATLKNDPLFPGRLKGSLEEVQALWFYQQEIWDSAAYHLVNALDEAKTKQERARWEYLAGQLFEKHGLSEEAKKQYNRAIDHTTDPVLDINARLNLIRVNKEGGDAYIDNNIAELLKMAHRDRYTEYRDVIYSMAAQMELERGNFDAARDLFLKASKYKTENTQAGNRAFIQLADLAFIRKDYKQAASFYDSVRIQNLPTKDAEHIDERKRALTAIVQNLNVVERQDSLQRMATMPEAERDALLKKQVRQLRKQQGLKEEVISGGSKTAFAAPPPPADLFSDKQSKGEWYFYNDNLKSSGSAAFKQAWGNRPNVDNWRRFSNVTAQMRKELPGSTTTGGTSMPIEESTTPTYEVLLKRLPITPEQLQVSNDSIQRALFTLGGLYVNELEDYPSAISALEQLRARFPQPDSLERVLFQLYYSYTKAGDAVKAAEIRKLMQEKFPSNRLTSIVATGKDPASDQPSTQVTKTYEAIYDQFLEGRFEEALQAKKQADSLYQTNSWSPQLLYIEAVYHIRNREDSAAKTALTTLIQQNGGTPMAAKAENMIQVLSRRQQIETELYNLQVERPVEDTFYVEPMPTVPKAERKEAVVSAPKDSIVNRPVIKKPATDSLVSIPLVVKTNSPFVFRADAPHAAVVILNKVDVVFGNETRNAFNRYNQEKYYSQPLQGNLVNLNDDTKLLIITNFTNAQGAIDYVQAAKAVAASQIVPWLKSDKYSFSIISEDNLKVVTESKDFAAYQKFLDQNLPVKF